MRTFLSIFLSTSLLGILVSCSTVPNRYFVKESLTGLPTLQYIGCGGYIVETSDVIVMADPYLSNIGPVLSAPFKKVSPDKEVIDHFFSKNKIAHDKPVIILISHSHYDHIADIPYIIKEHLPTNPIYIFGSLSSKNLLSIDIDLNTSGIKYFLCKKENKAIALLNKRVRILPVLTGHAPHICGIKLIKSKSISKVQSKMPERITKYYEGQTHNYLIDFLDEKGEPSYRILSAAGAASEGSLGIPDIKDRRPDLLLFCLANYNQVSNYPWQIIESTNPKRIIGMHWEDFFRPRIKNIKKRYKVPGTPLKKFDKRFSKMINSQGLTQGYLLIPDQKIHLNMYRSE